MPRKKKVKLIGLGLPANVLQDFIQLSYSGQTRAPDGFELDKELSNSRVKVYTKNNSKEAIIVHRGSVGAQDWLDNISYVARGKVKGTKSYELHKAVQEKAIAKYGAENLIGVGHSRGGIYLATLQKELPPLKEVISYNKGVGFYNMFDTIPENQTDVRTKNDFVSLLSGLQKRPKKMVEIEATKNPLDFNKAHQPAELEKLGDQFIGLEEKTEGGSFFQTPLPIVAAQYGSKKLGLFGSGRAPTPKTLEQLKKTLKTLEGKLAKINKGKVYKTTNKEKVEYELSYTKARIKNHETKGEDLIITKKAKYGNELPAKAKPYKAKAVKPKKEEPKPEPKKEEPKPEPKKRGRPKKEVKPKLEKPKQEPKVNPKKEVKQLLLEFKEIKEEPKIEVKEEPKIEVNQKKLKAIFDEIGATASKCKEVMCKYNIKSKDDFKKWIVKNHPDKGGTIDTIEFKAVIACAMKNKYCSKKMAGGLFEFTDAQKARAKKQREASADAWDRLTFGKKSQAKFGEAIQRSLATQAKKKATQGATTPKAVTLEEPTQQGIEESEQQALEGGKFTKEGLAQLSKKELYALNKKYSKAFRGQFSKKHKLKGGGIEMFGKMLWSGLSNAPEAVRIQQEAGKVLNGVKVWHLPFWKPADHITEQQAREMVDARAKELGIEALHDKMSREVGFDVRQMNNNKALGLAFSSALDGLSYTPLGLASSVASSVASQVLDPNLKPLEEKDETKPNMEGSGFYYLDEISDPTNPIYSARPNENIPTIVEPETEYLVGGAFTDIAGMNCDKTTGQCFNPVWEKEKIKRQILSEYKIWYNPFAPPVAGTIRMAWLPKMIEERYKPLYDEFVARRNVNIGLPADASKDRFAQQMFSNLTDGLSYVPGSNLATIGLTAASALSDTKK